MCGGYLADLLINEIHLRQTVCPSGGEDTVLNWGFAYQEDQQGPQQLFKEEQLSKVCMNNRNQEEYSRLMTQFNKIFI